MINIFKEKDSNKQEEMDKELNSLKLEDVNSLWYFVVSTDKRTIVGSKGE